MQMVLFVGIQAVGKSTFFKQRFFDSHVRVNLDMLRTRHREQLLMAACFAAKQPFVVDNTNVSRAERAAYIEQAKQAGFTVTGYYFQSKLTDSITRNSARNQGAAVSNLGIRGTSSRREIPSVAEGFDELFYVSLADGGFTVEGWKDEV